VSQEDWTLTDPYGFNVPRGEDPLLILASAGVIDQAATGRSAEVKTSLFARCLVRTRLP